MSIGVDCPGCRTTFRVHPKHAGKVGQCPRCRERVRVPEPSAAPVAATPAAAPGPAAGALILDDDAGAETYGLANQAAADVAARLRAAKAARAEALAAGEGYDLANRATADVAARVRAATAARAEAAPPPPAAGPAPGPAPPARTPAEILAAFRGAIDPVRPTAAYRAWIVVIAGVMVLLPAVYLALIAAVGYAVWWHATTNHEILGMARGRAGGVVLLIYAAPIVAGVMVIGFMLKPLFARTSRRGKVRKLDPGKEPLLFAFVDGVCSSVGAPRPSRIEVDCEVNASAHLASWALSPRRELVLTIGLPLVAGLTLRQFTGVLAHEFGHFAQGTGMRLAVLIRSINRWFARVVYERDEWDETLLEWSSPDAGWWFLIGLLIRGAVWATRRVLWLLMAVAHLVSGFLSRQMEFDADRYQMRMVGSDAFVATFDQLSVLDLASNAAHGDLGASWRERRLPDDLAKLVAVKQAEFPPELGAAIRDAARSGKTGLFDTHPATGARIARARAEGAPGIFKLKGAATELFRDFDALSRAATFDYYKASLGRQVRQEQLYPVAEALLNRAVEREGDEALGRYFLRALHPIQPVPLPDAHPPAPADAKAAKARLKELRRAMLVGRAAQLARMPLWDRADDREAQAEAAVALFHAGRAAPADWVDRARPTLAAAQAARDAAARDAAAALAEGDAYVAPAAERLALALGLLELDMVAARVPDGLVLRDEARALYPVAAHLAGRVVPELGRLIPALGAVRLLIGQYQAGKNAEDEAMANAVLRGARLVHERLTALRWRVGDALPYPFEHAQEGIGLGRFALPFVPAADEVGDLLRVAAEAKDRLFDLHRRVLGRLASTAQAVEGTIGLPPLAVPSDEGGPGRPGVDDPA